MLILELLKRALAFSSFSALLFQENFVTYNVAQPELSTNFHDFNFILQFDGDYMIRMHGPVYCISHNLIAERTALSSLCWNMAQILDFKATKRKIIIKTMFPQIPVQIISKSMQNTNVDLSKHPNLQNTSQSSENTCKHIYETSFIFIVGKISCGCHQFGLNPVEIFRVS